MAQAETLTFSATTAVSQYKKVRMNSVVTRNLSKGLLESMLPFSSVSPNRWLQRVRSDTSRWQGPSPRPSTVSKCTWSSARRALTKPSSPRKWLKSIRAKAGRKWATTERRVFKSLKKPLNVSKSISSKDKLTQEPNNFTPVSQQEAQAMVAMALRVVAVSVPNEKGLPQILTHVT